MFPELRGKASEDKMFKKNLGRRPSSWSRRRLEKQLSGPYRQIADATSPCRGAGDFRAHRGAISHRGRYRLTSPRCGRRCVQIARRYRTMWGWGWGLSSKIASDIASGQGDIAGIRRRCARSPPNIASDIADVGLSGQDRPTTSLAISPEAKAISQAMCQIASKHR